MLLGVHMYSDCGSNHSIVDTTGPRNVSSFERRVSISEVELHAKVYYWDLRNCPD